MRSGTDVTRSAGDVLVIWPVLSGIFIFMDLSHVTFRRIVFTFTWAFVYNPFSFTLAAERLNGSNNTEGQRYTEKHSKWTRILDKKKVLGRGVDKTEKSSIS